MTKPATTHPTPLRNAKNRTARGRPNYWLSAVAVLLFGIVFLVPFSFVVLTAAKGEREASLLTLSWPTEWRIVQNFQAVVEARDYLLIVAFINSVILTAASVAIMVVISAMAAFVLQRRPGRWNPLINFLVLSGLIIPPAVVPTITLFNFQSQYSTQYNLLFMNVLLITIPPLVMFLFFNRRIVAGLTAGAIKG